jgi:vacuolar-type H+-ATPase subunit I/STV1
VTDLFVSLSWVPMLVLIFAFAVVFAAKLDWEHYPTLGFVDLLLLAAPAIDGVFGLKPYNLIVLGMLMLAGAIFAVWYLVRQFQKPPVVQPERRRAQLCQLDPDGDVTRTIKTIQREAA